MTGRSSARRIAALIRPYRARVVLVSGIILVTAGLGVVNPFLIRQVFDDALFGPGGPDLGRLYTLVGFMAVIPVVSGTLGIAQTWLANRVGQDVMRDLRNDLYRHLQQLPLRFFTDNRTGEIQSRLANDVGGVQTVVTSTASTILSNSVIFISTLVAMVLLSWQLTIVAVGSLPVFIFLTRTVGDRRRVVTSATQQSMAEMSAISEETLSVSGVLLAKVFGRQDAAADRYAEENRRLSDLQVRQTLIGQGFFSVVQTFFSITPAVVYLVAGVLLSRDGASVSSGTVVAFTTLQARLFFPIGQLLQVSVELKSSLALFDRIFQYLDITPEIVDPPSPVVLARDDVRGAIEFRHVSFGYGPADQASEDVRLALHDVNFTIEPGQLAAFVGPSGAGKTTISYLVPRLYDVTEGSVHLDGVDVRHLSQASIAGAIGFVTQESYLLHTTVGENLRYGRPEATDSEVEAAARAAFIHERITELEDGYDTTVGERGYRLSGGEKQRLAIARVLLKDPRILVLDEATSALDTASERIVQAALQPLMAQRTTLAIAHRLSTIVAADVIFVLDRGRLVERGTHLELLAAGGLYCRLYREQFGDGRIEATCKDGTVFSDGSVVPKAPGEIAA